MLGRIVLFACAVSASGAAVDKLPDSALAPTELAAVKADVPPTVAKASIAPTSGAPGAVHEQGCENPMHRCRGARAMNQIMLEATASHPCGSCFSCSVYNLILNTAAMGATASSTVKDSVDFSGFRLVIDTGTKTGTLITLVVILVIGLLLLTLGETLLTAMVVIVAAFTSFMASLYLWNWCFGTNGTDWVRCLLPFILAVVCTLVITAIVGCLIKRFVWLAFFVLGAAGGAVGMFILRDIILAANPHLAAASLFNLYWLGLVAVAIICGIIAVKLEKAVVVIVTSLLGGYAMAVSICGLIPVCGGTPPPAWAFFVIFGVFCAAGFLFQMFVARKIFGDKRDENSSMYRKYG